MGVVHVVRGYLLAKSASSLGIQAGKTEFGKRLRDITIKEGSSWYLLSPCPYMFAGCGEVIRDTACRYSHSSRPHSHCVLNTQSYLD